MADGGGTYIPGSVWHGRFAEVDPALAPLFEHLKDLLTRARNNVPTDVRWMPAESLLLLERIRQAVMK